MLDEEFFRQYPVSVYHGIKHRDGSVVARLSNPRVREGIFVVTENGLQKGIALGLAHQRRCPQDNHNAAELQIAKSALYEVQSEKMRCDLPLDGPRPVGREFLTLLNCDPSPT